MLRFELRVLVLGLAVAGFAGCGGSDSGGGGGGGDGCGTGTTDCDGVCKDTQVDPDNCGECGIACADGETCVAGACAGGGCPDGFGDCDSVCTDFDFDPDNCGGCGDACGDGEFCVRGTCESSCGALTECGGVCKDTQVDPANCGGCGDTCGDGEVCSAGSCDFACSAGLTDCSGSCRDLQVDPGNCGDCGEACDAGEVCSSGSCELSCETGLTDCSGSCRDLDTDRAHCGACDDPCADGEVCDGDGSCALSCQEGLIDCGGTCVDSNTDERFCGATGDCAGDNDGDVCADGEVCVDGACEVSCGAGLTECGGACVDTSSDPANCGACDRVCADSEFCNDGTCEPRSGCPEGTADLNGYCFVRANARLEEHSATCSRVGLLQTSQNVTMTWDAAALADVADQLGCNDIGDFNNAATAMWYHLETDDCGTHNFGAQFNNYGEYGDLNYVPVFTCTSGCSSDAVTDQRFSTDMAGCAGTVTYAERATLCAQGWAPCTAAQWVARHGELEPAYDYWTNDPLRYSGNAASCSVTLRGGFACPAGLPMRVCTDTGSDPLGNTCNWENCGYLAVPPPNQYFGGCVGDPNAGTLCCR